MTAARSIRTLLATLILALSFVAMTAQPARAAQGLTTNQINAVISLLQAFDVPQATINTVKSVLGGGTGDTTPNASSASLDQDLMATGLGKFNITGTAANTKKVAVVLVPINYETYASVTDYNTIAGQLGKDGIFIEKSNVKNGRWSAQFSINAAATMRVVVFDYASKVALAKGVLTIGNSSGNTSEVTFTASPTSGKAPLKASFKGSGSMLGAGAYISFGDGLVSGYGEVNVTHTYSTPGTYVAALHKDGAKGEMVAFKTVNVLPANTDCNRNSNDNSAACNDDDEDEDQDEQENDNSSSDPVYTSPTVVVTYPKNSKGPYDITRDGHYGTNMLIEWRNYKMPAGSYACSYLYNGSSGTSYPIPETNNCLNIGTNNQYSSNRGYARVPAGNKYQAKVVAYNSSGAVIAQDLSDAVFSMEVMDRNSQEKKVARDTTVTDSAGKITFGGSATISKIYISMMQSLATVYDSPAITVTNGRWSHTTTRTFAQGTYSVAILDEQGNVLDSGFVYVNPSRPKDSTGGISVTEAGLQITTTANSLWIDVEGSTGKGCDGKSYTLDYGDGTNATILMGAGSSCQPIFTRSYPYKTAGTYTVKLLPSCSSAAACASSTPLVTKTVTVPGTTSFVPVSELVAALPYMPVSFYETMSKVTDMLAAVEMAPIYVLTDALSEVLFQAGLY